MGLFLCFCRFDSSLAFGLCHGTKTTDGSIVFVFYAEEGAANNAEQGVATCNRNANRTIFATQRIYYHMLHNSLPDDLRNFSTDVYFQSYVPNLRSIGLDPIVCTMYEVSLIPNNVALDASCFIILFLCFGRTFLVHSEINDGRVTFVSWNHGILFSGR